MNSVLEAIAHTPILFYLTLMFVSIISTSLGIGSFILIPLAAIIFGAKESIGIITLYYLFQNISKLIFFKGHANIKIAKKMLIWSIPGVLIGSFLLAYIPDSLFGKILGVAMIIFIINDVHKLITKRSASEKNIPIFGFFYGFSSGILGSGNLVKGPLFVSLGLLKESYIATYALTSLVMNIPKIGMYSLSGIITQKTILQSLPFLFISIIGTWLGKKVLKHISDKIFYYLMIIFFLITAISLLLK